MHKSEKFWKENIKEFENNDYKILRCEWWRTRMLCVQFGKAEHRRSLDTLFLASAIFACCCMLSGGGGECHTRDLARNALQRRGPDMAADIEDTEWGALEKWALVPPPPLTTHGFAFMTRSR